MWDGRAHASPQQTEAAESSVGGLFQNGLKRNWVAVEGA